MTISKQPCSALRLTNWLLGAGRARCRVLAQHVHVRTASFQYMLPGRCSAYLSLKLQAETLGNPRTRFVDCALVVVAVLT